MFESVGRMYDVQRKLSEAQAFPVLGPIFVSPVKALVSTAETIVGLVGGIFLGAGALMFNSNSLAKGALSAGGHAGLGLLSFGYSLANLGTLGFVGYKFEYMDRSSQSKQLEHKR